MNRDRVENEQRIFAVAWWLVDLLLFVALLGVIGTGAREYSVRKHLRGFSDALAPEAAWSREKVEAVRAWMSNGPPRLEANDAKKLAPRSYRDTELPAIAGGMGKRHECFPEASRSAGLETRRPLLLTPERTTKHMVAEVLPVSHLRAARAIAAFFGAPEIK
jgi:hypothetical protein